MRNSVCFHMDEPKNALKKNGPSRPSPRRNKTTTNHYHNNSQHIDYNPFVKTARFLQKCIEGIFGLTHIEIWIQFGNLSQQRIGGLRVFELFPRHNKRNALTTITLSTRRAFSSDTTESILDKLCFVFPLYLFHHKVTAKIL